MTKRLAVSVAVVCALALAAANGWAQGVQTGTITGTVRSADGLSLPGVTATATSPALQGKRIGVTDVNGVYFIKGLPAGTYSVSFELSSFKPYTRTDLDLTVGGTSEVSPTLELGNLSETVNVTAAAGTAETSSPTLSQVYGKRVVDQLPVGRTPALIADLAPGLTSDTPNNGQVTISGATAFDNVFMMNGVDINDNLFGSATTCSSRTPFRRLAS